jgi:hypothetical protein
MPVLPEDSKRYVDFLDAQVKALSAFDFKEDTLLWHYTSGPGLIGIVSSGTLYSTQVSCLSDSSEIRYAAALFKHALTALLPAHADDAVVTDFLTSYIKLAEEEPDRPNHAPSPFFVTCFSQMEDDLSQWRTAVWTTLRRFQQKLLHTQMEQGLIRNTNAILVDTALQELTALAWFRTRGI